MAKQYGTPRPPARVSSRPKSTNGQKRSKKTGDSFYWPQGAIGAVAFIRNNLHKDVFVIGIRAIYSHGVPAYRGTEDVDVYAHIDMKERKDLDDHLRTNYGAKEKWRTFGVSYFFPDGYELDVNRVNDYIDLHHDEPSWKEYSFPLDADRNILVYVPPIEDLIILKFIAGRKKDMKDAKHALRTGHYDHGKLLQKARETKLEKEIQRVAGSVGVKLEF